MIARSRPRPALRQPVWNFPKPTARVKPSNPALRTCVGPFGTCSPIAKNRPKSICRKLGGPIPQGCLILATAIGMNRRPREPRENKGSMGIRRPNKSSPKLWVSGSRCKAEILWLISRISRFQLTSFSAFYIRAFVFNFQHLIR